MKRLATITLGLILASTAVAAPGPAGSRARSPIGLAISLERDLFPPDLLLSNQIGLSLSADQVTSIKKQVGDAHARVLDTQVDLNRVTEQLNTALAGVKVDEQAVLALASQAMELEKQVKTTHLSLMIRVKNLLTPEQQERARALGMERLRTAKRERMQSPQAQPE